MEKYEEYNHRAVGQVEEIAKVNWSSLIFQVFNLWYRMLVKLELVLESLMDIPRTERIICGASCVCGIVILPRDFNDGILENTREETFD